MTRQSSSVPTLSSPSDAMEELIENIQRRLNESEARTAEIAKETDQFFLIVMSIVIFFMQCGFAFLEAGSVRFDD